jgi:hypothetical protein
MTTPIPLGWTMLRSRPVADGDVVLGERTARDEIGANGAPVERYGIWHSDSKRALLLQKFDEQADAELDFDSRT